MPASKRACIACSPHVSFVGYSIPHPSEKVVNLRIQTTGALTIPITFSDMASCVRSRKSSCHIPSKIVCVAPSQICNRWLLATLQCLQQHGSRGVPPKQ